MKGGHGFHTILFKTLRAVYCTVCLQFARVDGNKGPLITDGYRDWKHALDSSRASNPYAKAFKKHEYSNLVKIT